MTYRFMKTHETEFEMQVMCHAVAIMRGENAEKPPAVSVPIGR